MQWREFVARVSKFGSEAEYRSAMPFPALIYAVPLTSEDFSNTTNLDESSDTPEKLAIPHRKKSKRIVGDSTRLDLTTQHFPFDIALAYLEFLNQDKVYIGREPSCQIHVNIPQLSRKHAYFWHIDGGEGIDSIWSVNDNNSRNGTFVNRHRAAPAQPFVLKDRDVLVFSRVYSVFYQPSSLWILARHIVDLTEKV